MILHTPVQVLHQQGEKPMPRTQQNCFELHANGGQSLSARSKKAICTLFPFHSSWLLSWKALRRRRALQSTFTQHPGSQQDSRSPQRASPGGASISSEKQFLGNVLASTRPCPLQVGRDPAQFPAIRHDAERGMEDG